MRKKKKNFIVGWQADITVGCWWNNVEACMGLGEITV